MRAVIPHRRETLALLSILVAIAAWQATGTMLGLLAPFSAAFLYMREVTASLVNGALAVVAVLLAAMAGLALGGNREPALDWAALCAVAFSIGATAIALAARTPDMRAVLARRIIEAMPAYAWSADPTGRFTYVSPNTLDYVGFSAEALAQPPDVDGFSWRAVVHPEDYTRIADAWRHCLATGSPYDTEHRIRRHDGVYRWFRNAGLAQRDDEGRIVAWHGTTMDIDDEKRAEATLIERERELSQLVDMVPSHLWRLTPDGETIFFNRRMADFLGFDVDGMASTGVSRLEALADRVHPDDRARFRSALGMSLAIGESFSLNYRLRRADGVYRWMSSRAEPLRRDDGAISGWYGLCVDVDDQMRADEALRSHQRQLQQLIDTVPVQIWCTTPAGEPDYVNRAMVDFLGLALGDFDEGLPKAIATIVHPDDRERLHAALTRSFTTGEPFELHFRNLRHDGTWRWMEGRANPLRDESGRIIRWYGANVDIDDLVRAQEEVRAREARIRRLVDSDVIGIVIWDLDGTLIDANDAFLRMVQYDRAEVEAGLDWFAMTPPDWQDVHARQEAEELLTTGRMQPREKEYFRKDGSRVPVLIGAACFEGQSRQGVAYILDLTEIKRVEASLRDRERELSQLVDMVPSYLWRITPEGVPVFFNRRLVDFLNLDVSGADQPGRTRLAAIIASIIHPDDAASVARAFEHSLATGEGLVMKWRMRRADGVYRWMSASAEALRDENGCIVQWYGLCHDIDDQVLTEAALRRSKQQLELMIDAIPVNVLSFDPAQRLTYASQRYLDTVGAPPEDIVDFAALAREVAHPDDFPIMFARACAGFAAGEAFVNRFRRLCSDGVYRWIEARAQALRDAEGAIVQWYIASIDIEEEMQAQEALRERERFLWQLVETLPAMIVCADPAGEPVYRSEQLRAYLGFGVDALDGSGKTRLDGTLDAAIHPDDLPAVRADYAHSLGTGEPYLRKHRLRRADGEYRWVETRAAPMRDKAGAIVQWNLICLDIEGEVQAQQALRLAQERLARASQAASLAELSASIAHEVNQPLAAVVANSQACHRWLSATPPNLDRAKITAERITRDANAAADVVGRIRALFRQSIETRTSTNLADVIAEARDLMAEEAMRRRIRLRVEAEAIPPTMVDRVQIQQVLVNLIRNGMDALETVPHQREVRITARPCEDAVRVEVADGGPGIEAPEKIFEPFFTTKAKGMGMGLAICRSIVEAHGGRLWAEANDARGATFVFTLPAVTKVAA
ncbi:PAS domain-containing protein [Acuticoccus sp. I52.16.1]|uniref:PAS domain-containing protein n=1 Tax=Acuticoccus sp. I52.16.1 TaxID=2928472 RepID=UPI001FD5BDEA|nr:PAS domain-containing protein [Acuticoccus sp. I52.16.1]UOM36614.1 PAS domain-containing protein [Acuticoccus sp. I52.16.1]